MPMNYLLVIFFYLRLSLPKHSIMAKASKKSPFLKAAQKGEFQNNAGKPGAVSSKATFTMKSNPARKKG